MNKENFPIQVLLQNSSPNLPNGRKGAENSFQEIFNIKKDAHNRFNKRSNIPLGPKNLPDSLHNQRRSEKATFSPQTIDTQSIKRFDVFENSDKAPKSATLARAKRVHIRKSSKGCSIKIETDCSKETPSVISTDRNEQENEEAPCFGQNDQVITPRQEESALGNATACFGPGAFETDNSAKFGDMEKIVRVDGTLSDFENSLLSVKSNRRFNSKSQACAGIRSEMRTKEEEMWPNQALNQNKRQRVVEFTLSKFYTDSSSIKAENEKEPQMVNTGDIYPDESALHTNNVKQQMEFTLSNFRPEKHNEDIMHEEVQSNDTRSIAAEIFDKKCEPRDDYQINPFDNFGKSKRMHVIIRPSSKESNTSSSTRRSASQRKLSKEQQCLILDVNRKKLEDYRPDEVQSCRIENNNFNWDFKEDKLLSSRARQIETPINKPMEVNVNPMEPQVLKKSGSNSQMPTRMKSPRQRFLVNVMQVKKTKSEDIEHPESEKGIQRLAEENDHLRKENYQKEELIEFLLGALKHKDSPITAPDHTISSLPVIESFMSPKDNINRINFNRAKLTSAERPFTPKNPSLFCQKPFFVPHKESIDKLPELERGRSHEQPHLPEEPFDLLSPQLLKASSIPNHPKPPMANNIKHPRTILSISDGLSVKRVFSSPIATQFENHYENSPLLLSSQLNHNGNQGISDEAKIRAVFTPKGGIVHQSSASIKSTLTNNARIMLSNMPIHELISQCDMITKPHAKGSDYGHEQKPLRESLPEVKLVTRKSCGASSPEIIKTNVPMSLHDTFSPKVCVPTVFQDRQIRGVSPTQKGKQYVAVQGKLGTNILIHDEYNGLNFEYSPEQNIGTRKDNGSEGLKIRNSLSEATNSRNSQSDIMYKEVLRQQSIRLSNENHNSSVDEDAEGSQDVKRRKLSAKREKFPKDVFSMNIRKKFFC